MPGDGAEGERKFAAILSADVAGYSLRMEHGDRAMPECLNLMRWTAPTTGIAGVPNCGCC